MNEPTPTPKLLRGANQMLSSRGVPVRFVSLSYINRDHETFIGLADPIRDEDLAKNGFIVRSHGGTISIAFRNGEDSWTIGWRTSQTDRVICCAVEGDTNDEFVRRQLAKLD